MSEAIERLDYTKAPPRYRLVRDVDGFLFIDASGKRHASAMHNLGGDWREDFALARAWAQYKREHDPPGMRTRPWGGGGWAVCYRLGVEQVPGPRSVIVQDDGSMWASETDARAAAWAWYDRRLAIAAGFDALGSDPWPWPECLSWSDKQASTAELHLGSALPPDGGPTRG